jgi:4-amino-4-deoxy-L-arabinose transferase-like glycosyltransferase
MIPGDQQDDTEPAAAHDEAGPSPPGNGGESVKPEPAALGDGAPASQAPWRARARALLRLWGLDADPQEPAVPAGNGWHPVRGTLIALVAASIPFLIMTTDRHWSFSVPVGVLCMLVAAWGVLDLFGTFDDAADVVVGQTTLAKLAPKIGEVLASLVAFIVLVRLAVWGVLPKQTLTMAVLTPIVFMWLVIAVFRTGRELGVWSDEDGRTLLKRHGFWLILIVVLLYLPMLGSYSLTDPWETQYGEVAREMLARDDWISTWWAQDGWFYTKPVFDLWIQAFSFLLFGVRYMPDKMLSAVAHGHFPQPEWANRMPVFILTLLGVYALYKAIAKVFGRRAGFLAGLALTTMPLWYLLAHQTMCDMPYVGPMTASMALLLIGFHTDPEARVKQYEVRIGSRTIRFSAYHLLFGVIIATVLPQVLYLLSRNLTLQIATSPHGFRPHLDEFLSGSGGGNCGLPGNSPCHDQLPVDRHFQPWQAGLLWAGLLGFLLWMNRGERRAQRLCFLGAWYFMALSALAKGAPGLVIPWFVAGVYVGATRRWKDFARLEILGSVLVLGCVCLPWYVQMYVRHGTPFTDQLLFDDMYKRAFVHVHDTNAGNDVSFRYYVWQLGYSLFPWVGLGAGGLLWALRRKHEKRDPRGDASAFLMLWFITAFGMITVTLTKYYYYIFPAVPAIAAFVGILLDRAFDGPLAGGKRLAAYLAGIGLGMSAVVYGLMRWFPGAVTGWTDLQNKPPPASRVHGALFILVGVVLAVGAAWRFGRLGPRYSEEHAATEPVDRARPKAHLGAYDSMMVGVLGLASAFVVWMTGTDLFVTRPGDVLGNVRLTYLITYNYSRPWPQSLDFNGIIEAFTIASTLLMALLIVRRWRVHVLTMFLAVSILWGAWGVNAYLVEVAPHWGQRKTLLAYYRDRKGPQQPFIAYQMNWKGENFYTGNHVPAFVSTGERFRSWITEQKKDGVKVMYFTTEWGRMGSLKSELGEPKHFTVLTTRRMDNKFFLARVNWD